MSDKTSAELERDAERVRAELADTTEELRGRMSPGQLMDEALQALKGGDGQAVLTNLKAQAVDNPMALALIGSGVAWLMMGSGRPAEPYPDYTGAAGAYRDPYGATGWSDGGGYPAGSQSDPSGAAGWAGQDEAGWRDEAARRVGDAGAALGEAGQAAKDRVGAALSPVARCAKAPIIAAEGGFARRMHAACTTPVRRVCMVVDER